jgi:hypothetical protein
MRNLINIITEKSRGLLYRKAGDTFFQGKLDNPTAVITFEKAEYFPAMPGAYTDYNEMSAVGQELYKLYPTISWFNKPTTSSRAFAILSFAGPEEGQKTHFGKFFGEIKPDMQGFWKNSELPGGWQLNTAASLKGSYFKLKPSDLYPPNSTFNGPKEILQSLMSNQSPDVQKIIPGMKQLLSGSFPVFANTKDMKTAVRDDLGETVGPIALVLGLNVGTGAEAARVDILGANGSYSGSKIKFPTSKIYGLVDSYIYTPDGFEIGISSKGDKDGARASIKNVSDGIKIAQEKGRTDLLKKYAKQLEVINAVGTLPAKDFPIKMGVKYNMINEAQGNYILGFIKAGTKSLDQVQLSKQDRQVFEEIMTEIAPENKPAYNLGYHILAGLARRVVNVINQDPEFGRACLIFVNMSPIIQLHLQSQVTGDDVAVTGFTSKYPPNFEGSILLDAGKSYYSTSINGRCAFGYDPLHKAPRGRASKNKSTDSITESGREATSRIATTTPRARRA